MKAIKLISGSIAVLFITFSCSTDKQSQLTKLKEQQTQISDKIKNIEDQLKNDSKEGPNPNEFKFIGITEIQKRPFDHFIRVQGKLDGDHNAAVFAEVPGTISAKFADVGQHVVKGQVLAQIDDKQYRSQLEGLETQYQFAQDMYDKQKRLWDQKIGSEIQYLQSKTTMESLQQQIESLKQQIEKFKLKSPIEGTIEECNIKVGGVVSPDPRLAAYRVIELKNLKVTAEVSEAYSEKVKKGDKLLVHFPDVNKELEAQVSFVSNYINPVNRTFMIETKINSNSPDLKANMIAIIRINDYHSDSSMLLPMNVIQIDPAGSYVYVIRPKDNFNAAYKQPVKLGTSYNGIAEIVDGLNPGDKVISIGYQELVDGEYVRF
jgi:membrane fusion protein, multidrug efflux system